MKALKAFLASFWFLSISPSESCSNAWKCGSRWERGPLSMVDET